MAEGLKPHEKSAVDKALLRLYRDQSKQPLLSDLYFELQILEQLSLCEKLDKYVHGSLADVFNAPTNIKLDNRLVIFDIKDLPESLRQIMMLIISNFVQNQVKAKPEKRLLGHRRRMDAVGARGERPVRVRPGTQGAKVLPRGIDHIAAGE